MTGQTSKGRGAQLNPTENPIRSSTAVVFNTVRPQKSSTLIAEQMLAHVQSGHLNPGDRLPPERQLAEQFGVNRQAVREALSALHMLGIVETRPGSGSVIVMRLPKTLDAFSEIRRLDEQDNPFEIMEARAVIEPEIVRLAASRASQVQLANIEKAIEEYAAIVQHLKSPPGGDLRIHLALAQASGNAIFTRFIESVLNAADQWLWRRLREEKWDQKRALLYLKHHQEIFDAIRGGDAERAVQAMGSHLSAVQHIGWGISGGLSDGSRNLKTGR
jgi:GntR family transcriptional repressor for pyruvate dehydrogenase complex